LNSIPHRATQTPTLNSLAHGAPLESSWFYELRFSSDLAPPISNAGKSSQGRFQASSSFAPGT
jgi:hypothetical protein